MDDATAKALTALYPEASSSSWVDMVNDLVELVEWLAMPYGDNRPVFATELPDGRPLDTGVKLERLFTAVMGEKRETPGAWVQCEECRAWHVAFPGSDRHLTDQDAEETAKQLVAQGIGSGPW